MCVYIYAYNIYIYMCILLCKSRLSCAPEQSFKFPMERCSEIIKSLNLLVAHICGFLQEMFKLASSSCEIFASFRFKFA